MDSWDEHGVSLYDRTALLTNQHRELFIQLQAQTLPVSDRQHHRYLRRYSILAIVESNWLPWTSVALGEVTTYRIASLTPSTLLFILLLDTVYRVQVRMGSSYGFSEWSNVLTVVTKPAVAKISS